MTASEPEDRREPITLAEGNEATAPRLSTAAQIALIVGVVGCLAAGMLWLSGNRSNSAMNGGTPQTLAGSTTPAPRAAVPDVADANAKTPSEKPTEAKPEAPKVILDWIEYSPPGCESTRSVGVNIIEQRGEIDAVTLIWRDTEEGTERSRRIYRNGKQWTSYLQGVPNDTNVQLLAKVSGPGGETTVGENISRYC